jgi:hypothetical protein
MVDNNLDIREGFVRAMPARQTARRVGIRNEEVFVGVVGWRLGIDLAQDAKGRVSAPGEQLFSIVRTVA